MGGVFIVIMVGCIGLIFTFIQELVKSFTGDDDD